MAPPEPVDQAVQLEWVDVPAPEKKRKPRRKAAVVAPTSRVTRSKAIKEVPVPKERLDVHACINDGNSDDEDAAVIGGLVDNSSYFVHSTTTNTFKLSESHSNCGDAAVVSLTGLSSDGTKQTFTSQGKPGKGQTWPDPKMPKYDGA